MYLLWFRCTEHRCCPGFFWIVTKKVSLTRRDSESTLIRNAKPNQTIDQIGKRDGFGDLLADGSKRYPPKKSQKSDQLAQHIKGLEATGYDLRSLKTAALAAAVSFRGADHSRSGACTLDLQGKVDRLVAEKGRGKLVKDLEDIFNLIDSLIVCKNAKHILQRP
jgi:aldehyde:ferredoxin oxidoreductase